MTSKFEVFGMWRYVQYHHFPSCWCWYTWVPLRDLTASLNTATTSALFSRPINHFPLHPFRLSWPYPAPRLWPDRDSAMSQASNPPFWSESCMSTNTKGCAHLGAKMKPQERKSARVGRPLKSVWTSWRMSPTARKRFPLGCERKCTSPPVLEDETPTPKTKKQNKSHREPIT